MIHTSLLKAEPQAIQEAASILKKGGLVAFPTETVYGLGAAAFNAKAAAKIFAAKKRPSFDPLIVHVSDPHQAEKVCAQVPPLAKELMRHFWPGPLTLVLPKSKKIPDIVTSGLDTVAVRLPAHPAALAMIRAFGEPVAAPSANLFGRTSPTTAKAVLEDLKGRVELVLDGGPCEVGVESTILKIPAKGPAQLLRAGGVPLEELRHFCPVEQPKGFDPKKPQAPGNLKTHYAPQTPFVMIHSADELENLRRPWPRIGALVFRKPLTTPAVCTQLVLSPRGDMAEAAANLFDMIRRLDKMNLDLMVAEPVSRQGLGLAIMDRLEKSTSGRKGINEFIKHWEKKTWKARP